MLIWIMPLSVWFRGLIMELDKKETKLGTLWFIGAGTFAVLLSIFIAQTDLRITHSDSEKIKGQEMREVRMAQSALPGSKMDPRSSGQ